MKQIKEFTEFVAEQGVVGLAVGLAVGVAAGGAVNAIVKGLIDPLVGFIIGGNDLSNLVWETGLTRSGTELVFAWGAVVSAIINLLAVAFVIFYLVKKLGLDKLDKKKS